MKYNQMKKYAYPFTYTLDENIHLHIEYFDDSITIIRFDNNNHEEIDIPTGFSVYKKDYNGKNEEYNIKVINPFRNTQTYAISKGKDYYIEYNYKTIIKLKTTIYCTLPPIIEDDIIVL